MLRFTPPMCASLPLYFSLTRCVRAVLVATNDGRVLEGVLRGFDQTLNIILEEAVERVFSISAPVERVPLGLYIVRGDNVSIIGELDEQLDAKISQEQVRAHPLKLVVH
jgi:U6 snRNA-associated Sm-like protein LSm8